MSGFEEIDCASQTDVGVRRSHNQDARVLMPAGDPEQWQQRGHVVLVADGMGGHAVGELASKLAVDNIPHVYSKHAAEGPLIALRRAFVEANLTIHNRGRQNREFHGMGTTATALVLRPEGAWIGHVGDSRAYRIRGGAIEQLSFDHSWLWELARHRGVTPEELERQGVPTNRITRSLGPEPLVQVDVEGPHPILPGDTFLLCSDGLSGEVTDREIGAVAGALPPAEACRFLVLLANLQGGRDNVTVAIARVRGELPAEGLNGALDAAASPSPWASRARAAAGRIPWGLALLLLGIALAIGAIALGSTHRPGALLVFISAGVSLLTGLLVLLLQSLREGGADQADEETPRPPPIYRRTLCPTDEPLLERLARATATLHADVEARGWHYEAPTYHEQLAQATRLRALGQLPDAFRAQCRAMLVLMEAVHLQRGKEEAFNPLWDRPAP